MTFDEACDECIAKNMVLLDVFDANFCFNHWRTVGDFDKGIMRINGRAGVIKIMILLLQFHMKRASINNYCTFAKNSQLHICFLHVSNYIKITKKLS